MNSRRNIYIHTSQFTLCRYLLAYQIEAITKQDDRCQNYFPRQDTRERETKLHVTKWIIKETLIITWLFSVQLENYKIFSHLQTRNISSCTSQKQNTCTMPASSLTQLEGWGRRGLTRSHNTVMPQQSVHITMLTIWLVISIPNLSYSYPIIVIQAPLLLSIPSLTLKFVAMTNRLDTCVETCSGVQDCELTSCFLYYQGYLLCILSKGISTLATIPFSNLLFGIMVHQKIMCKCSVHGKLLYVLLKLMWPVLNTTLFDW